MMFARTRQCNAIKTCSKGIINRSKLPTKRKSFTYYNRGPLLLLSLPSIFHFPSLSAGSAFSNIPSTLLDPPKLSLVPPDECQFTDEFEAVELLKRETVSDTTAVLRFATPDRSKPLGLSTCACILAKTTLSSGEEVEDVIRPYTPISTNEQVGSFDLLVKKYENGKMSRHMHEMPVGSKLEFKHIKFNVKIQAPFSQEHIGMLVGGTGVAPMIQALHAILGDDNSKTKKVSMLYGSRVSNDILGEELLKSWCESHKDKLEVVHVLSHEPEGSDWNDGERGFIGEDLIKKYLPSPDDDGIIFVCGPPPMYDALCGPREEQEVKGILGKMGYKPEEVYKF